MATLASYANHNNDGESIYRQITTNNYQGAAQPFTIAQSVPQTVTAMQAELRKTGSPTEAILFQICADNNGGNPGTVIMQGVCPAASVSSSFGLVSIAPTQGSFILHPGVTYWFVLSTVNWGTDNSNYYQWGIGNSSIVYTAEKYKINQSFTTETGYNCVFEIDGSTASAGQMGNDSFDSYVTGALAGNYGGQNFGSPWLSGANDTFAVENSVAQTSPNGVSATSNGSSDRKIYRYYATDHTTGIQGFYARLDSTSGELNVALADGGFANSDFACYLRFGADNKVVIFSSNFGATTQVAASYNANQWYKVEIQFDLPGTQYRARIDGGAWTAYVALNQSKSIISRLVLQCSDNTSGKTMYWDSFFDGNAVTGTFVVVAGGGGGGSGRGGGGGAGGMLVGTVSLANGSYAIVVGGGGIKGTAGSPDTDGSQGNNSSFSDFIAVGGGGGGRAGGHNGGSGGGASGIDTVGTGISGQGFAGGTGSSDGNVLIGGGGGGGATTTGGNGTNGSTAGNGGTGLATSITGSSVTYAGGGGGGSTVGVTAGSGGTGGGGAGNTGGGAGTDGTANTGGGGGGGGRVAGSSSADGGAGGSGIVIIAFPTTSFSFTGGNSSGTDGAGNTWVKFTADGTLVLSSPSSANGNFLMMM